MEVQPTEGPFGLIIAPSRELAHQTYEVRTSRNANCEMLGVFFVCFFALDLGLGDPSRWRDDVQ